jgi:hypothetical protein
LQMVVPVLVGAGLEPSRQVALIAEGRDGQEQHCVRRAVLQQVVWCGVVWCGVVWCGVV